MGVEVKRENHYCANCAHCSRHSAFTSDEWKCKAVYDTNLVTMHKTYTLCSDYRYVVLLGASTCKYYKAKESMKNET